MKISHMLAAAGLAIAALGASTGANAQNYYGGDRSHDGYRDHDSRRYDRHDRYDHDRRWYGRHHRSYRHERCYTEWHHHHRVEICR
jgi:hypothetical protein